ncbi:MAG: SDR family NAD(P)-dependent oxidoreductase [Maricaulaceae bacterium]
MSDRVVLITGGAQGIGFACARRFYEDGFRVVIADTAADEGAQALSSLQADPSRAIFVECDVSDKLEVHNLVAEAISQFGRIDVLINNAGIAAHGGILEIDEKDFDQTLAVNLRGAFLVSKAVIRHMVEEIENREDRSRLTDRPYTIINMSSINEQVAIPNFLAYAVSKGGLKQLTRAMALDLAPYGIRVNGVGPGSIKTKMLSKVLDNEEAMENVLDRTPLGRIGQPDEVAGVCAFLASEDASYITGQTLMVDGGRLALNAMMPRTPDEDDL